MGIGAARAMAVMAALAMVFVACGGSDTNDPAQGSQAGASPTGAGTMVQVADSDLGSILVDADGMTLYLFEADANGSSTCTGDCATTWPALVGEAPSAGDGVDASLLGTTTREDGQVQVSYDGHPLYHYAADASAGDTNGQGIGDVWYVVDSGGAAVTKTARGLSKY